jgi:hypothetical protein
MQTATYIYAKVIGELESRLSAVVVSALFDDSDLIEINDNALVIYTPSDFRQRIYEKAGHLQLRMASCLSIRL